MHVTLVIGDGTLAILFGNRVSLLGEWFMKQNTKWELWFSSVLKLFPKFSYSSIIICTIDLFYKHRCPLLHYIESN